MMSMMNGSGPVDGGGARGTGAGAGSGPGAGSGGESITLADIKVGDMVAGQGALKNGVFVPTELGVADPSQQRRRRQADGNATEGATTTAAPKTQQTAPAPQ